MVASPSQVREQDRQPHLSAPEQFKGACGLVPTGVVGQGLDSSVGS